MLTPDRYLSLQAFKYIFICFTSSFLKVTSTETSFQAVLQLSVILEIEGGNKYLGILGMLV